VVLVRGAAKQLDQADPLETDTIGILQTGDAKQLLITLPSFPGCFISIGVRQLVLRCAILIQWHVVMRISGR
jgi:hypothetical protein